MTPMVLWWLLGHGPYRRQSARGFHEVGGGEQFFFERLALPFTVTSCELDMMLANWSAFFAAHLDRAVFSLFTLVAIHDMARSA